MTPPGAAIMQWPLHHHIHHSPPNRSCLCLTRSLGSICPLCPGGFLSPSPYTLRLVSPSPLDALGNDWPRHPGPTTKVVHTEIQVVLEPHADFQVTETWVSGRATSLMLGFPENIKRTGIDLPPGLM